LRIEDDDVSGERSRDHTHRFVVVQPEVPNELVRPLPAPTSKPPRGHSPPKFVWT
jgi:hypothetical protein